MFNLNDPKWVMPGASLVAEMIPNLSHGLWELGLHLSCSFETA
jgi:hypothetical protein